MQVSSPGRRSAKPGSAELARQLVGLFHYVANASNREVLPQVSDLDLSLTQLKALFMLDTEAEGLSVKTVAEGLGLSMAATSRAVEGLHRRALVDREEDLVDRRVKRVRLTATGRKTVQSMMAIRVATLRRLIDSLTDDQRSKLSTALEAIVGHDDIQPFYPSRGSR